MLTPKIYRDFTCLFDIRKIYGDYQLSATDRGFRKQTVALQFGLKLSAELMIIKRSDNNLTLGLSATVDDTFLVDSVCGLANRFQSRSNLFR